MRALAMAMVIGAASSAWATVPSQFSVQGVLRNGSGQLQSMAVNITVKLYAAQSGGSPLSTPVSALSTPVTNGLFTVTVNVDGALATVLSTPPIWLELVADADTFPRQLVTPDVYALQCGTADNALKLGGSPASDYLKVADATSTYLTQASASSTYLTQTSAASTYQTQSSASSTYLAKTAWAGFFEQDIAEAAAGNTTSMTFVDSPFPVWNNVNIPVAKSYLLAVDVSVYETVAAGAVVWQVVATPVAGGSPVTVTNPIASTPCPTISRGYLSTFHLKLTLPSAGLWNFKLQWKVAGASETANAGAGYFRIFTLIG